MCRAASHHYGSPRRGGAHWHLLRRTRYRHRGAKYIYRRAACACSHAPARDDRQSDPCSAQVVGQLRIHSNVQFVNDAVVSVLYSVLEYRVSVLWAQSMVLGGRAL